RSERAATRADTFADRWLYSRSERELAHGNTLDTAVAERSNAIDRSLVLANRHSGAATQREDRAHERHQFHRFHGARPHCANCGSAERSFSALPTIWRAIVFTASSGLFAFVAFAGAPFAPMVVWMACRVDFSIFAAPAFE